jgi:hypothetical protein
MSATKVTGGECGKLGYASDLLSKLLFLASSKDDETHRCCVTRYQAKPGVGP